ncbi:hypothetical protein ABZX72_15460 [Streptomyces cyaneofuscatus]|uniref:hypothetical protein n=1 Tax=Streptomyces cyaneofuscatus TaxID=66883 RepID=UPI0033B955E7
MLTGFQEWLVVRLGKGHDLTWPILVRHLTPGGWTYPLSAQTDVVAVTTLYQLIGEFFTAREQPDGLAQIFRNYQSWATTQDWYHRPNRWFPISRFSSAWWTGVRRFSL